MGKEIMDYCLNDICEMEKTVVSWLKSELAKGQDCVNIQEFKELCDGVKDLAEAKKYLKEACYFDQVTTAMEEADTQEKLIFGYNNRHMMSGKFAPKGEGHVVKGYDTMDRIPFDMAYIDNPDDFKRTMRMYGYHDGASIDNWHPASKHGETYDKYQTAKRYYHEGDQSKKNAMKTYANEHVSDMVLTVGEMFNDADPEQQMKMMKSIEGLLNQWKVTRP